jgi:hypothetical protein
MPTKPRTNSATSDDAPKPKGRPAGSANKEYADAVEIPATCPSCGGVELTKVPGSKELEQDYAGELPNGFRYRSIVRIRKRCACGQCVIVRTFIPADPNPEN